MLVHGFYTHQPYFMEILKNTTGNILECGCGEGSTIMIRKQIRGTNRKLVSLESNLEWLNKYTHLADDHHHLQHVDADNEDCIETGNKWVEHIIANNLTDFEVVFLDSSPWMSRKCCFDYFLNKAKIIIIHDFDYFPNNNIIGKTILRTCVNDKEKIECDLTGVVKNYKLFYPPYKHFVGTTGPPTLVCSNIMDPEEFDDLIRVIQSNEASYYMEDRKVDQRS